MFPQVVQVLLQSMYFLVPAYAANVAPVFARKIDFLNYPLDFNRKFKGQPLLGKHKTFRGFFFGVLSAILMALVQHLLYKTSFGYSLSLITYNNWLTIGFLLGFGALVGDSFKSFFKRRLKVKPGNRFIPWDQLDFVFGALVFVSIVYIPPVSFIIAALVASFCLHVLAVHCAYYTGIRKEKW